MVGLPSESWQIRPEHELYLLLPQRDETESAKVTSFCPTIPTTDSANLPAFFALSMRNPDALLSVLRRESDDGNPSAMCNLAWVYWFGTFGMKKQPDTAYWLWSAAGQKGSVVANCSRLLIEALDDDATSADPVVRDRYPRSTPESTVREWRTLCRGSTPSSIAQLLVARALHEGFGIDQNQRASHQLMIRAARTNPIAAFYASSQYAHSEGVVGDMELAWRYLHQSANAGFVPALRTLAFWNMHAIMGSETDALRYAIFACQQRDEVAIRIVTRHYWNENQNDELESFLRWRASLSSGGRFVYSRFLRRENRPTDERKQLDLAFADGNLDAARCLAVLADRNGENAMPYLRALASTSPRAQREIREIRELSTTETNPFFRHSAGCHCEEDVRSCFADEWDNESWLTDDTSDSTSVASALSTSSLDEQNDASDSVSSCADPSERPVSVDDDIDSPRRSRRHTRDPQHARASDTSHLDEKHSTGSVVAGSVDDDKTVPKADAADAADATHTAIRPSNATIKWDDVAYPSVDEDTTHSDALSSLSADASVASELLPHLASLFALDAVEPKRLDRS